MMAKVLLATPCYGDMVSNAYFRSVLSAVAMFHGHPSILLSVFTLGNESLVTRARNTCVATFLKGDYTHLLFVDADIEFDPTLIVRLLERNTDVACACYPQKTIVWDRLPGMFAATPPPATDAAVSNLLKFNVHVSKRPGAYEREVVDGFVSVDRAATGFMLIRRPVFTRLAKAMPELKYVSDDVGETSIKDHLYLFFDCRLDESRKYMSEDYAFCDLVKRHGMEIWLDVASPLGHVGTYTFRGCVGHTMRMERVAK